MRSKSIFVVWGERFERYHAASLAAALVGLLCLASGLALLWIHTRQLDAQAFRAASAVSLILLGVSQLRCAVRLWQRSVLRFTRQERLLFLKWIFLGSFVCYLAGLLIGPDPSIGYIFCTAVAAWYTAGLWAIAMRPAFVVQLSQHLTHRLLGRTNQAVFASVCTLVAAESIARLYCVVANDPLPESYIAKAHVLPPGEEFRGRLVNTLGYWDKEFDSRPRPGIFRIAVLGDGVTLSGNAQSNCLAQIERRVPGIEIYNFGIPQAGPREYAAQLAHDVLQFRPDLVLTFFSVGDDLTEELPLPGVFDWHGLRMYQLGARNRSLGHRCDATKTTTVGCREAYLRRCAAHLAVCRTPIDEQMGQRWQEAGNHLSQMADLCRRRQIPLALVVVPGPFQVNAALCDALRRQAGYEPKQVDLQLPQRRLTALAAEQSIPVVDLLPYFQSSGQTTYQRYQHELNEHGNQLATEVIGRWIEQQYRTQIASARQAAATP